MRVESVRVTRLVGTLLNYIKIMFRYMYGPWGISQVKKIN